jgi:hypothetical protein
MVIDETNKILLGSKRFQGSTDVDTSEKVVLEQTSHEEVGYERTIDISLLQVFDDERQASEIFRPTTKFSFIFKNTYSGTTNYQPYYNYLYYVNLVETAQDLLCGQTTIPVFYGFPQYDEFDFIRTDNNKLGYTIGTPNHQGFINKSASTYNWSHYLSYPFENDFNKPLFCSDTDFVLTWNWQANQGIPFYIRDINSDSIVFKCPMKHGLSVGEYVKLSLNYNGTDVFAVSSLGDGGSGSDEYIFHIDNIGFIGTTFTIGVTGFMKRVLDPLNEIETTSKYYVRKHKIITFQEDAIIANSGYEQNIFNKVTKYEKVLSGGTPLQVLTPPSCPRTSVLEGSQNYTLSFNNDIDISGLLDNQKRPVSKLYFTTIWKGYYGWTNRLKEGHYFNSYLEGTIPNSWWSTTNPASDSSIPVFTYNTNFPGAYPPFIYNGNLTTGDTIDGDFCEWNDFEQNERIISRKIHKFTFNQNHFVTNPTLPNTNKYGYYYFPLNPITIKAYSDYIEEGIADQVADIPPYSFYSNASNGFRWRDIYPYGYIDSTGIGVDYPFTNGKHYPFTSTIFRVYSEGTGVQDITQIADPTTDECE